jgi:hypothetical protein
MAKLTTDTIGTERIDIYVDGSGLFSAEYLDERYSAETRKLLLEKLEKAVKAHQNERAIPVSIVNLVRNTDRKGWNNDAFASGRGVIQAKLRGKHQRLFDTWLYATDDDKQQRFSRRQSYRDGTLCRRLTDAEIAEYLALAKQADEAEAVLKEWITERAIDPEEALTEEALTEEALTEKKKASQPEKEEQ